MHLLKIFSKLKFIFLLVFVIGVTAIAQNFGDSEYWEQLKEIQQKTRLRQYPGGSDESDLKVQSQLNTPERKLNPVQETQAEAQATD